LLTYRCGAANRRFGPITDIARSFNRVVEAQQCCRSIGRPRQPE
jgi:hypothetical protein